MPGVWFATAMRSDTGPHRCSNQDAAAAGGRFVVVADGVGGHAGGDVASRTVTRGLVEALDGRDVADLGAGDLRGLVAHANAALHARAAADPLLSAMATTLTALFCGDGVVRVAHVGDSRAYRLRDGVGELVTHDDSLVQSLVDSGAIREQDAVGHPQRHIILRSLSGDTDDAAGMALLEVPSAVGDRWVVCSDGLSDTLGEDEVLALAARAATPDAAADALLGAALAADAHDNVTLAVCDVVASPPADDGRPRWLGAAAQEAHDAG